MHVLNVERNQDLNFLSDWVLAFLMVWIPRGMEGKSCLRAVLNILHCMGRSFVLLHHVAIGENLIMLILLPSLLFFCLLLSGSHVKTV